MNAQRASSEAALKAWPSSRSGWTPYIVAVGAVAIATVLRSVLDPWLGDRAPLFTYFLAVVFVAGYGGRAPALVTGLLGYIVADLTFFDRHVFLPRTVPAAIHASVYAIGVLAVSFAGGRLLRTLSQLQWANIQLEESRATLQEEVRKRTEELKYSNEALRRRERLSSLGTLAAGVAHDIGNLLLPMRAHLEAIDGSLDPRSAEHLTAVKHGADHLQRLSSNLRLFAGDPSPRFIGESVDLHTWYQETETFLRSMAPAHITLTCNVPKGLPRIPLTRAGISQVVFSLLHNAARAIGDQQHGHVELCAEADAEKVTIIVTDDGPGMEEDVRAHCMDPFFSTSPRGMSTGLGLSVVNGLVTKAGGTIDVQSPMPGSDRGTAFVITLPAVTFEAARTLQALVTVDDSRVASLIATALRQHGFAVEFDRAAINLHAVDLWVTDTKPARHRLARAFKAALLESRVIVVGDITDDWKGIAASAIPSHPTFSDVREALNVSHERV